MSLAPSSKAVTPWFNQLIQADMQPTVAPHEGLLLSLNTGGTGNQATAYDAVVAAFKATRDHGCPPTIVMLQECTWALEGSRGLLAVSKELGPKWRYIRQYEEAKKNGGKNGAGAPATAGPALPRPGCRHL